MAWPSWGKVPPGEQNFISNLVDLWEQSIGYSVLLDSTDWTTLANAHIESEYDLGQYISRWWGSTRFKNIFQAMPWALYGLDKDTYSSMSESFSTTYKKITGQDITSDALAQAFKNPRDMTGGLLTASQYAQQLMNDVNIQKAYGWVRYGLDYEQWTQQKLTLQMSYGRTINDSEAATLLQYNKAASGAQMEVTAARSGQQQSAGAPAQGGSVIR